MAGAPHVLKDLFRERFGGAAEPRLFRAPGRVNLIGEHTDYNLGFVMPIALDLACFAAAAPASDGMLRIWSENVQQSREFPIDGLSRLEPRRDWSDYVVGVAREILEAGHGLEAMNVLVHSTVPVGSGLSSSAALEVSSALALLHGRKVEPLELVRMCHRAENRFVGMPCGVMDQYVSVFGREGSAIEIDCRTYQHQPVPLPSGIEIVAVNSMVKHELGSSAYRERVAECNTAVQALQQRDPLIKSLRDAGVSHLEQLETLLTGVVLNRARHVITENARVQAFVKACEAGDLPHMGKLFVESHRSLQHDYEVSAPELDFLVDTATALAGVYGARMTGGGFGGCTVNLVAAESAAAFEQSIVERYRERYGITPVTFRCKPSAGACEV